VSHLCHMSHLSQLSLACVIGLLMCHMRPAIDFNDVGRGQKVLSRLCCRPKAFFFYSFKTKALNSATYVRETRSLKQGR
jgi:hypothetical protein